jgi:hypothetical protein
MAGLALGVVKTGSSSHQHVSPSSRPSTRQRELISSRST